MDGSKNWGTDTCGSFAIFYLLHHKSCGYACSMFLKMLASWSWCSHYDLRRFHQMTIYASFTCHHFMVLVWIIADKFIHANSIPPLNWLLFLTWFHEKSEFLCKVAKILRMVHSESSLWAFDKKREEIKELPVGREKTSLDT